MKNIVKSCQDFFVKKPKTLFLVDALGAVLTTFSLYFILRPYHLYLGMPEQTLSYLTVLGLFYVAYSMSCYFLIQVQWARYLKILGIFNISYCLLTASLLFLYSMNITPLGYAYFLLEILIILLLAFLEFRIANILKRI